MPKKRFPNALDDLGTIPDLERIVAQADAASEWVRRHDETIRRLTSNPAIEALERQQEFVRRITQNPLGEALQAGIASSSLLRASEAMANSPMLKAAQDLADSPTFKAAQAAADSLTNSATFKAAQAAADSLTNSPTFRAAQAAADSLTNSATFKAAQAAADSLANSPLVREAERWSKIAEASPLLKAYKAIEESSLFKANAALVEQMRLSDRQFAAVADLSVRIDDSPLLAAAREAQAVIDRLNVSMPDWTRLSADIERFAGASSVPWEKFRRDAETVAAHPEQAEKSFSGMAAAADAVVAAVPVAERETARKIMRELMIQVVATAIVEAGKEASKVLWPCFLLLLFGVASFIHPTQETVPLPAVPAITAPAPMPDWRIEGLPDIVVDAGADAVRRTIEFFTTEIRNPNTRRAYAHVVQEFSNWCDDRNIALKDLTPFHIAAYIEELGKERSAPTVKQALAALRMWFDYLVVGQVLPMNPASSVRGPKHAVKRGKTPVLPADQARTLLDSIDTRTVVGLRDRAFIGLMIYSFARVGAVVGMRVGDYYPVGKRWWFGLHEKRGKRHEVPAHHNAEAYLNAYLDAAAIREQRRGPLFRTIARDGTLSERAMHRTDVLRMIKRRARRAGLPESTCCHTFRATGITAYLENGGTVEKAQQIAAHESPRTTKLYDRTSDELTLDEIERIAI